jgi:hypothetical protein
MDDALFRNGDLWSFLDGMRSSASTAVEHIPREQFIATTIDTLTEHVVAQYTLSPLVLYVDQMRMDSQETKVNVTGRIEYDFGTGGNVYAPGQQLTFYLPFSGDARLWKLKPDTYSAMPRAQVDTNASVLIITLVNTADTEPNYYKRELDSILERMRQIVASQTDMLAQFNGELRNVVRAAIERRRAQLEGDRGVRHSNGQEERNARLSADRNGKETFAPTATPASRRC